MQSHTEIPSPSKMCCSFRTVRQGCADGVCKFKLFYSTGSCEKPQTRCRKKSKGTSNYAPIFVPAVPWVSEVNCSIHLSVCRGESIWRRMKKGTITILVMIRIMPPEKGGDRVYDLGSDFHTITSERSKKKGHIFKRNSRKNRLECLQKSKSLDCQRDDIKG